VRRPASHTIVEGVRIRLLTPGWIVLHLLLWGSAAGMVLLGRWQLHVAAADGYPLQNTSYVVQWWLFAACALAFWVRLIRDALRPPPKPRLSPSGELVLRSGQSLPSGPGPALLQTRSAGRETVAYRGYHLPDSSRSVVRSHGDPLHDAYNDYLWQLALADGEARGRASGAGTAGPAEPDGRATGEQRDPDALPS
jgi:hypothetical protein